MTHERLITLLHCSGMEFRHIGKLSEFSSVHLTRIESWLDRQMWVGNADEIVKEMSHGRVQEFPLPRPEVPS